MKLTRNKLLETLRRKNDGWTTYQARKIAGISIRRVNQVYVEYTLTGEIPQIGKKVGRPSKPITDEEIKIVKESYGKYRVSASTLRRVIDRDYNIRIFSNKGIGFLKRKLENDTIHYAYNVVEEEDPLGYENISLEYNKFYSKGVWLEKTLNHDLPDIPHRLFGFFDGIHAPNLVVTSDLSWHFLSVNKLANKRENVLRDCQTHDGLYRIESIVPLTLAGPGIKKGAEISMGRNIDILPTLLNLLGIEYDDALLDGEILTEALE